MPSIGIRSTPSRLPASSACCCWRKPWRSPGPARPPWRVLLRWSLWSVLWILAKPQNAPIGLILGLFTFRLAMWTPSKPAAGGGSCQRVRHVRMRGLQRGRHADLRAPGEYLRYGLLGHLCRNSKNPEADLRALGLDPQLAKYSGTGAWTPKPIFRKSPPREC